MPDTVLSLLLLPAEIRTKIYDYIWSDNSVTFTVTHQPTHKPASYSSGIVVDGPLVFIHTRSDLRPSTQTGILSACRQIYKETVVIFYSKSYFFYIPWESLRYHMKNIPRKVASAAPANPFRWHWYKVKKPKVPLQYLPMIETLHLVLAEHEYFEITREPQLIARALRRFSVAKIPLKRLVLEFRLGEVFDEDFDFANELRGHIATFCRNQCIAQAISDTTVSTEIQIEVTDWARGTAESFEHFVRSIAATKGWVCDEKRDEACMREPTRFYGKGAFQCYKHYLHSLTATQRLIYDEERKEARLENIDNYENEEANTFYWCWRLQPGKTPSSQPSDGLLPELDLSTLSLTEKGSTPKNNSTSD